LFGLPTAKLVTPRRWDIAVKWRFFREIIRDCGDQSAEALYRWHIWIRSGGRMASGVTTDVWKRSLDDYVTSARRLLDSMASQGFLVDEAVPIDPNGEFLNGSHRVACALALGISSISVERHQRHVWAPPWGEEWFRSAGMASADLERLRRDMNNLMGTNPL
jgi:hypothetical protein